MELRNKEQIGKIVCDYALHYRRLVYRYADCAINAPTDSIRDTYTVKFKAALLVYGMLEMLCEQYDFNLTS